LPAVLLVNLMAACCAWSMSPHHGGAPVPRQLPSDASAGTAGTATDTMPIPAKCWGAGVPEVADSAEDFRFAEVLASYAYGNSPRCGKPPH
jgi:hypothetical protein